MPSVVTTGEARALFEAGAQFVDVLPPASFTERHIAGAVNVPLDELVTSPSGIDPGRSVVVYCYDHQ